MIPTRKIPQLKVYPLDISGDTDICHLFGHFCQQPWAMLLDSANSPHQDGRFDIIVASPVATIVTRGESSETYRDRLTTISTEDPIALLQGLTAHFQWDKLNIDEPYAHLPFMVGAAGYLGYELGGRFEVLADAAGQATNCPDMAIGFYDWSIIKDNLHKKFYLCTAFDTESENDTRLQPDKQYIESIAKQVLAKTAFTLTSNWQSNMDKSAYIDKVSTIKDYLCAGDCYQVNLAQRFCATYQGDEWQAYLKLRSANMASFSAFIRLPECVILSISPERFIAVANGHVESKPIKGTRARSADPIIDAQHKQALHLSDKDRAENLMIVDLLRNDLSKHCAPGSVEVPSLFSIQSYAAVHHMVSTVSATLDKNKGPLDLLRGAFPGGSITGAPKIRAMQIIRELEPHRRNIYCGSIGYLGYRQDMDTSICIRTLLCEENTLYCWAGGGIVVDSNAEDEYQETLDKVSKILPLLQA
jgi:para-aminobenzoate synthetase component 1